jgi:hypothetical protein
MNKKLAHTILFFGDLLSFGGLWIGYHIFSQIMLKITNHADIIKYGNRVGFFIVGIGFPLLHIFAILEHFLPEYINKYKRFLNYFAIALVIILLSAGFVGSNWIKTHIEKAGYIYCHNASGVSALAKSIVYTKDMDICDELIESKRKRRK